MAKFDIIESKRLYDGPYISVREDTVEWNGKQLVKRAVVEFGESVVIAPLDDRGRVYLVRQYRHPLGKRLLELPAGGIHPGETPAQAAQRELREEVGVAAGTLERLGGFYSAPGFCDEFLHFFVARDLRADPLPPDDDEEIEVVRTPLGQVDGLIRSAGIEDAKSIAGLMMLRLFEGGPTEEK